MFRCSLALILLIVGARARAQSTIVDVSGPLAGQTITHLAWLEDKDGRLGVSEVARRIDSMRGGSFGGRTIAFSASTFWVRLPVRNSEAAGRRWFLEIVYPHLDDVALYTPRVGGGYDELQTGDIKPFRTRDVWFYNFLFDRTEPPLTERTYYLRIRSRGTVSIPLRAWEPNAFYRHQLVEWGAASSVYAALLVMAAYVVFLYFVLGGVEHLYHVAYLLFALAGDFTLSGHTFQLLLPNHPEAVHRLLPLVVESGYVAVAFMVDAQARAQGIRLLGALRWLSLLALVLVSVLPYELGVQGLAIHTAVLVPGAIYAAWSLARAGARAAGHFLASFSLPLLGLLLTAAGFTLESGRDGLMRWAFLAGVLAQSVLVSSRLAEHLNHVRARLVTSNALHAERIDALSAEMGRATRASLNAERATAMRTRFMATLGHEFRTPLNAIINIPEALREDFPEVQTLKCGRCEARFELEPGEVFDPSACCLACGAPLHAQVNVEFTGDGMQTKQRLGRVQRAGRRLLRVVNDILQFSRMQARRVELLREHVSLASLIRRSVALAVSQSPLATDMVRIEVSDDLYVWADDEKLAEVFLQLLDNAVKFARGSCAVTITARQHGDECFVSVRDEGIGIPPADRERIFSEFAQVSAGDNRRYGGVGLGLTLCRAYVEAHGGKIWVESTLAVESTFCLMLPASRTQVSA